MNRSALLAMLGVLGLSAVAPAQVRRDVNGHEPGESRHMMENVQRQQQRHWEEQQREYLRREQQHAADALQLSINNRLSMPPAPTAAEQPEVKANDPPPAEQSAAATQPSAQESNHRFMIGIGVVAAAILAVILMFRNSTQDAPGSPTA